MKPESAFYQKMKKGMTKAKITRVESWVNLGIPDCIVAIENHFHLVELKIAQPNGKIKISPHQIAFHSSHRGFPTWIFVQTGKGKKAQLMIYSGHMAMDLAKVGALSIAELQIDYPWDWLRVEQHLIGKA